MTNLDSEKAALKTALAELLKADTEGDGLYYVSPSQVHALVSYLDALGDAFLELADELRHSV